MRKRETTALVMILLFSGAPAARADGAPVWTQDTRGAVGLGGVAAGVALAF